MSERLKVLKQSYQHKGETRIRVSVVDTESGEKYDDLSLDLNESGYRNFVNNGGEEAMCVACDYVSGLKKDGRMSETEAESLKDDWVAHANSLADEMDLPDDDIRRTMLQESEDISPLPLSEQTRRTREQLQEEPEDSDGDGIPDTIDNVDDRPSPSGAEEVNIKGKAYRDWPEEVKDRGLNGQKMDEKIILPTYISRPGDEVIKGENNTYIVLGRDRTGQGEDHGLDNNNERKNLDSGYGSSQAAGAIDIVVGRGAPFPLGSMETGPTFMMDWGHKDSLGREKLKGDAAHPGFMMDAARIYVSQKTDVDHNFKINDSESGFTEMITDGLESIDFIEGVKVAADITKEVKRKLNKSKTKPGSAVVAKADQVRLIAREEIKLVTSGPEERFNSQGGRLKSIKGIHLVAGNGEDAFGKENFQEPIPKGKRLLTAIDALVGLLHDLAAILEAILMSQMEFNAYVMTHFHLSPLFGVPTTPSPLLPFAGMKTMIDHLVRGYLGIIMLRVNLGGFDMNYLKPNSKQYILSRYNTTN